MGIENLGPVFKYFEEISAIPRGSGNEQAVSDYLVDFARTRGLWVHQDECLNVIIRKSASAGYESAPAVVIQGHMDMVCEKNRDTVHDFTKDGIKLVVDGDFLRADGTTLGADNGIAVAMGMALLDDNTLKHPALEVLITTNEEGGMTGVAGLDPGLITGRMLINLDSEEEGVLLASCAGGMNAVLQVPMEVIDLPAGYVGAVLRVSKLNGGHSGADIHKELANSNRILSRALCGLNGYDFYLAGIEGGSKPNAIPREAEARLAIRESDYEALSKALAELEAVLRNEYSVRDPEISLTLERSQTDWAKVFTKESGRKVSLAGSLLPNGIQSMSMSEELAGIVESSLNIGVVSMSDGNVNFICAIRSSVASRKYEIAGRIGMVAEVLGASVSIKGDYPVWEFDRDSRLQKFLSEQYKAYTGKDAVVTAIHAGLECGLFAKVLNKPDMVSMGPDIFGAHTPDERVSISSTIRLWGFLKYALENMK